MYRYKGMDNFHQETIELARAVINRNPGRIQNYQMNRLPMPALSEETSDYVRKLAADFMNYEFDGIDWPDIQYAILSQTDRLYGSWTEFAAERGLESPELQQAGWEMIFGGDFTYIPSMQKFY